MVIIDKIYKSIYPEDLSYKFQNYKRNINNKMKEIKANHININNLNKLFKQILSKNKLKLLVVIHLKQKPLFLL